MAEGPVVVVGDALIDELRGPEGTRQFPGGAALNVALGLSVLGIESTLIAMVGDDADGDTIRAALDERGVRLIATAGPLGSSRAVSDRREGEPRYVFNAAAQARRIEFGPNEHEVLDAARLVAVSCFPFDDTAQVDALIGAVANPQRRLLVDPNPRLGMMNRIDRFGVNFERVAALSLLVKVGDEDAELLYGEPLAGLWDRLVAGGAGVVLATAGREGASVRAATGLSASAPIAALPGGIIDTMGAGDATFSAVIERIDRLGVPATNQEWLETLSRAMLIAGATCRREGALLVDPTA